MNYVLPVRSFLPWTLAGSLRSKSGFWPTTLGKVPANPHSAQLAKIRQLIRRGDRKLSANPAPTDEPGDDSQDSLRATEPLGLSVRPQLLLPFGLSDCIVVVSFPSASVSGSVGQVKRPPKKTDDAALLLLLRSRRRRRRRPDPLSILVASLCGEVEALRSSLVPPR